MAVTIEQQHRQHVRDYFSAVAPWAEACSAQSFSYFGRRDANGAVRIYAATILLAFGRKVVETELRFGSEYVAGRINLPSREGVAAFVERLLTGEVGEIGKQKFALNVEPDCGISVAPPNVHHQDGALPAMRLYLLDAVAGRLPYAGSQAELAWALRAAVEPYESVAEVLRDFGLPSVADRCSLQVMALPPIQVWKGSNAHEANAELGLWLPSPLAKEQAALTYRVIEHGRVVDRATLHSYEMDWDSSTEVPVGKKTIDVPIGAAVQCFATYAGEAYHAYWVADPKHFPNPRLAAFEVIDPGLQVLRSCLFPIQTKNQAAPNFEAAAAWLVWAYGFAPISLGRVAPIKDGPDILAVSPQGHFVVVECTLGLLKADNKLARLVQRTVAVREKLQSMGIQNPLVIPLIVTALPREHVAGELAAAAENGVLVATKENLEAALNEVVAFPDGDAAFTRLNGALNGLKATQKAREAHGVPATAN